jgi:hypothetical protein
MISLAHIINPFKAHEASDLKIAQPITFASMIVAKSQSGRAKVELISAQFARDRSMVPPEFKKTSNLTRSVCDLQNFRTRLHLPIIKDILDRLYAESEADYLIYTNVDIGLQPHFYERVVDLIELGHDALIINRRRIPAKYTAPGDLSKIYQEASKSHPGFDCFVFHRSLYPNFQLASICIGVPFIGITMAQNIFALAKNYCLVTDEYLTFHLGMEIYAKRAPAEYFQFNRKQFWLAMQSLRPLLHIRKQPFYGSLLPVRLIKWGLHPNFPIRLMLILEWRNLQRYF